MFVKLLTNGRIRVQNQVYTATMPEFFQKSMISETESQM